MRLGPLAPRAVTSLVCVLIHGYSYRVVHMVYRSTCLVATSSRSSDFPTFWCVAEPRFGTSVWQNNVKMTQAFSGEKNN